MNRENIQEEKEEEEEKVPLLDPEAGVEIFDASIEDEEDEESEDALFPDDDLHFVLFVADLLLVEVVVVVVRAEVVAEVLIVADVILELLLAVNGFGVLFPLPVDSAASDFLISIVICFLFPSPGDKSLGERVTSTVLPSLEDRMRVVEVTTSSDRSTRFKLLLLRVVIRFALN